MKKIEEQLGNAFVRFDGDMLAADTGVMSRTWRWTGFECELVDESRGFFMLFREPGSFLFLAYKA